MSTNQSGVDAQYAVLSNFSSSEHPFPCILDSRLPYIKRHSFSVIFDPLYLFFQAVELRVPGKDLVRTVFSILVCRGKKLHFKMIFLIKKRRKLNRFTLETPTSRNENGFGWAKACYTLLKVLIKITSRATKVRYKGLYGSFFPTFSASRRL